MSSTRKTLKQILISKVRIKALKYFALNPDQPIHLREAVRTLHEEINAVRRELDRLSEVGFLKVERQGNRKCFRVNVEHPYYDTIIHMMHKAYGLGGDIVTHASRLGKVNYAFLTNSYTHGVNQGMNKVDLMLVGEVDMAQLADMVKKYEDKLDREIHYTVLKPHEFSLRKRRKDAFVMELLLQPKVMLIGRIEGLIEGIT